MLRELENILNGDANIEEVHMLEAGQALLAYQFLHRKKPRHKKYYELVVRFETYFSDLMEATNNRLIVNESKGYVGVTPIGFVNRMRLDEVLLLLTLRALYDQEIQAFKVEDNAEAHIILEDFELRYFQFTKRNLPKNQTTFDELMRTFSRLGVADQTMEDEIKVIRIYPTINDLVDGEALTVIEDYLSSDGVTLEDDEEGDEA